MNWKDQLYNHEVPPPEKLWGKICHDLDNDAFIVFKEQLAHAELAPPAASWERICHDIDNEPLLPFKDKLQYAEITPPDGIWHRIDQAVNNNAGTSTIVPFPRQTKRRVFQLIAAAAAVAIIFFSANYFFLGKDGHDLPGNMATQELPRQNNRAEKDQPAPSVVQPGSPAATVPLVATNRTTSRKTTERPIAFTETEDLYQSSFTTPAPALVAADEIAVTDQFDLSSTVSRRIKNLKGEIKEDVSLLDLPNSYFFTTGPNGQTIRVSAKFRNTIQYLDGDAREELLDVILRESAYWKSLFKQWKEKMANSSFVPSTNNFMDITELTQFLRQNQDK